MELIDGMDLSWLKLISCMLLISEVTCIQAESQTLPSSAFIVNVCCYSLYSTKDHSATATRLNTTNKKIPCCQNPHYCGDIDSKVF